MVVVCVLGNDCLPWVISPSSPEAARQSQPAAIAQGPEPCGPHLGLERRAFGVSYNE